MTASRPQICFLLALWGKNYIKTFCDISLRTLLAPGNIPALAQEYQCTFTLLTTPTDIPLLESHPLFPVLRRYCQLRYVDIQDTVFQSNHSAILTIALERGMRSQGSAMLDTYFIFLVADYLFAGQALSGLLPYLRKGISAISAGNYQVVKEEVLEDLTHYIDPATGIIDIPNRDLVAWSLCHLNPTTVANIVNVPGMHLEYTNRLFWRVGSDTLIGRFYLKHMLCIRPEIADYVIGSSCDYSFIAEMCPSGNVAHLADSDEYFVVELQPLKHEGRNIVVGPQTPENLAKGLSEWTTPQHRANAHLAVIFHAGDMPPATEAMIGESKRYIERIEAIMSPDAAPLRGHYYWTSCIQWIVADMATRPDECAKAVTSLRKNVWESPVFSPPLAAAGLSLDMFPAMRDEDIAYGERRIVFLYRLYLRLFGKPYAAYLWHPRFFDYALLSQAVSCKNGGRTLVILIPKRLQWLEWSGYPKLELRSPLISFRDLAQLRAELQGFSSCIIYLPEGHEQVVGTLFNCLLQAMPVGSEIHIFVKSSLLNSRTFSHKYIALCYAHLGQKPGVHFIRQRSYTGLARRFLDQDFCKTWENLYGNRYRPLHVLWYGFQMALLHACYVLHNMLALVLRPFNLPLPLIKSVCSSVLTFRVEKR